MADMIPQGKQLENVDGGYEHGDANIRAVVSTMTYIMVTVFVSMLAAGAMTYGLIRREKSHDVALTAVYQREIPPEPRLLPSRATGDKDAYDKYPWELGAEERAAQAKAANTPYWIDKSRGQVSIPVEQAIDIVAKEDLPARQSQNPQEARAGAELSGDTGVNSPYVADAGLDGSMVSDTSGGRSMSSSKIEAPPLGN